MTTTTTSASANAINLDRSEMACRDECILRPGNTNCGGCGMSVGLTLLARTLSNAGQQCELVIPACCGIVSAGAYPTTGYNVPVLASTFGSAPAYAAGLAAVRDLNDERHQVICWAGDGGTYDIGMATLSAAAERNDNVIYICYDNEIYGNTGGQRSSATPVGARTTTSPFGKIETKKDVMGIMAAHRVPYAATLSIAHPDDFQRKINRAINMTGFRFFLIHSPCPTGWKSEPADSVELVRIAIDSGLFPVYEVFDGVRYRINVESKGADPAAYFERQGRFKPDEIDLDAIRQVVASSKERLRKLAQTFPATDD